MTASLRLEDHRWTITPQQGRDIQSKASINVAKILGKLWTIHPVLVLIAVGSQLQRDVMYKYIDGINK